jgi:hypothetical protein
MTVDEFVKTKVLPEYWNIVAVIRQLIREMVPDAAEAISYGMPVFKKKKIFAYLTPNKNGITFSFTRGTVIKDKYGLLRGTGKSARYVKINSLETANIDALKYYIKQALELDQG